MQSTWDNHDPLRSPVFSGFFDSVIALLAAAYAAFEAARRALSYPGRLAGMCSLIPRSIGWRCLQRPAAHNRDGHAVVLRRLVPYGRAGAPCRFWLDVDLRLSSEAKRVTQRANGAWIYTRDRNDTHYDPMASPAEVPLDVLLQPGESSRLNAVSRCPRRFVIWAWSPATAVRPAARRVFSSLAMRAVCFTSRP